MISHEQIELTGLGDIILRIITTYDANLSETRIDGLYQPNAAGL
jgi:hypothetical protein